MSERKNEYGAILLVLAGCVLAQNIYPDEIKFQFKSPSFSGIGTSSHYLTIDSQEMTRKEAIAAEIKALKEEAEREAENSTLARFIKNFEFFGFGEISPLLSKVLSIIF